MHARLNFKLYGEHTFAAIDLNDGASATANVTITGPDTNNDNKVDIKDIAYLAKYFGSTLTTSVSLYVGVSATILIPAGMLWLRKNKQRKLRIPEN